MNYDLEIYNYQEKIILLKQSEEKRETAKWYYVKREKVDNSSYFCCDKLLSAVANLKIWYTSISLFLLSREKSY